MSDSHAALLDRYEAGAELMRGVLALVPQEHWDTPPAPDEWTARQVFIHLADSELVGAGRIRQLLAEEGPTLYFYSQNDWARNLGYTTGSPEDAVALAVVLRRATARLLRHVVTEAAWARKATHPLRGEMGLETLLELYAGHIEGHIAQLEGIAAALAKE